MLLDQVRSSVLTFVDNFFFVVMILDQVRYKCTYVSRQSVAFIHVFLFGIFTNFIYNKLFIRSIVLNQSFITSQLIFLLIPSSAISSHHFVFCTHLHSLLLFPSPSLTLTSSFSLFSFPLALPLSHSIFLSPTRQTSQCSISSVESYTRR